MAWPIPEYSRSAVNKAGKVLSDGVPGQADYTHAMDVLSNWRSCHSYPINTFQSTLRSRLEDVDPNPIVAQRLKRTPSIISKLKRFDSMQLARMQDIGGLRSVVGSLAKVKKLEEKYRTKTFKHELVADRNYVQNPKASGYRSIHLVYRYQNDRVPSYNGLLVELQIRTRLQHTWATAVETMGTFLDHALKSSEGPEKWLKFFSLSGSAFAHLEKMPPVPGYETMTDVETYKAVDTEATRLDVRGQLQGFTIAVNAISKDRQGGSYHLVVLDPVDRVVSIGSFGRTRLDEANAAYTREEGRIAAGEPIQVVLVSAGPIESLKRAYPNYFLDTKAFVRQLDRMRVLAE